MITYPPEMLPGPEEGQGADIIADGKVIKRVEPMQPSKYRNDGIRHVYP